MKVNRSAIPAGDTDDGIDSLDGGAMISSFSPMEQRSGPSAPVDFGPMSRTFSGTVTGRITSDVLNDLDINRTIPLSGIYVQLKERDKWWDEDFGTVHCDANGFYTINFSKTQSDLEGRNIELYVIIKSKNTTYDIKTKKHAVLGAAYDVVRDLGSFGTSVGTINADINTNLGSMRVTSWAVRCWEYCGSAGNYHLISDLSILPHANGSNFVLDGLMGVSAPFAKPTIRLESEDCDHENTIYHEFGHFMMWNIQNRNFIIVYVDPNQDGHSWDRENTPERAWAEGWADAMQMIMDAAHWWEDQEYGYDEISFRRGWGPYFEQRARWRTINNGIWAEYYIATALYDLWGGSGPSIPDVVPSATGDTRVGNDDTNGPPTDWTAPDNVRYGFNQIILPLQQNTGGTNKLKSIEEYFYAFRNDVIGPSSCEAKATLARVFRENRVVRNISDFQTNTAANTTSLSGDDLYISQTINYIGSFGGNFPLSATYKINPPSNYFQTTSRTIDLNFGSGTAPYLNENLFVNGSSTITNSRIRINPSYTSAAYAQGTLTTCANPRLTFTYANLELGGTSTTAKAEASGTSLFQFNTGARLVLNAGSRFVVKSGATLHIRNGSFVDAADNTQIIVESGGYVCIEQGAVLNLRGSAGFVMQPGANVGVNPALSITSGACNAPPPPNEALQFDGSNDYVDIPNNSGGLNHGISDFTWEAYVRLNSTGTHQVILSKRVTVSGSTSDGFMFGVWSTGRPWVQLAGSPNIHVVTSSSFNLLDGNCHHVAVRRSGTTISFFVDGQFVGNGDVTSSRNINSTGSLWAGRDRVSGFNVNGWIGEVRIWNHARSNTQIASSVGTALSTPQTGLVSYFKMRQPNGSQVLTDVSGNGILNTGRLGSATGVDTQDPVWLSIGQVTCSVQGNFGIAAAPNPVYETDMKKDSVASRPTRMDRVTVYPNPSKDEFVLVLASGEESAVDIRVVNATGVVIETRRMAKGTNTLRFGKNFFPGTYLVRISSKDKVETIKVIKQ